jgi:hypothetical protein
MFEEFKAKHGGLGPVQLAIDQSTHGALSDRIQRKAVGEQMDATLAEIQTADDLTPELKKKAGELLQHGVYDAKTALGHIDALRGETQEQRTVAKGFAPVTDQLQSLYDKETNPQSKQVLSTLLANAEAARQFALDPATRQQGLDMFGKLSQDATAFTVKNKADQVAADVADAQFRRDLPGKQFDQWEKIRDDWSRNSASHPISEAAWKSMQELGGLKEPNSVTDQNFMRAFATVMNPNTQTRPGENPDDALYAALPFGIGEGVKAIVTNGGQFTAEQKSVMMYVASKRIGDENAAQMDRNTRAIGDAKAAGFPSAYIDRLSLPPIDLGAYGQAVEPGATPTPTPPPPGSTVTKVRDMPIPEDSTAAKIGDSTLDGMKAAFSNFLDFSDAATGRVTSSAVNSVTAYRDRLRAQSAKRRAPELPTDEITTTAAPAAGVGGDL